jgi:tetratricopeptide (TPR) repeat protein
MLVPLFFNVYTSRVFEPDKIALLRSLVLIMAVAWLVKLFEGGYRAYRLSDAPTRGGRAMAAVQGATERGLPPWLGFLRVPMVVPILVYALAYLISTLFTVTPDATLWGSYQRLQGTYTQYSYILLAFLVIANLRTREQLERLVNFMLFTSLPVALYGMVQAMRLDPLPWAGDTASRVASTMGNAIFVAAWLIMVVPFTLYRLMNGISEALAERRAMPGEVWPPASRTSRKSRVTAPADGGGYTWAVVANSVGIIMAQLFIFYFALKLIAGLSFPDARMWPTLPLTLATFYISIWAIERLGKRRDDPLQVSLYMPAIGAVLFLALFMSIPFSWGIERAGDQSLNIQVGFDGLGLLWVLFFMFLWGAVATGAYALSGGERVHEEPGIERRFMRMALNWGYGLLMTAQLTCIYLTQSRGPWLGLGAGLVTFALALWLVGRRRGMRWMARIGGTVSALVLMVALFVVALNIPGSPLKALDSLPVLGRGIERLSTLTQTDVGTGKVRTLIWKGATDLILSDPVRAVIGWGPEAMYVAYSPFYPPELAHWELRNATPDRSHNVEFDQLVTVGALGLLAYYFLVGAFFFYGIRTIRRAVGTRDQLLAITLVSAMAAHFIEIQTGIQIAATWTYFYLIIAMMVALGYFITGYLRVSGDASASAGQASGDGAVEADVPSEALAQPVVAATTGPGASKRTSQALRAGVGGDGRQSARAQSPQGSRGQGRNGGQPRHADPRQRQARLPVSERAASHADWMRNPAMAVVYVIVAVAVLTFISAVNVATVRADTLYKQGLAYDNAGRWPESIELYSRAIALQPNQDYYYLFLGRAWLEFAKQADQEQVNMRRFYESQGTVQEPYLDQKEQDKQKAARDEQVKRRAEKEYRLKQSEAVLKRANELNPLNADHYANLGRLYLYWGDPTGGNDPTKQPLAVQYMEKAVGRAPGNAQLWDELAVAYSRNNQFDKAIQTLEHSQNKVDPQYARTPFIRGQLYQERAMIVKSALQTGRPLPTNGETDYGKLVLEAGKAYSETIALDQSVFVDSNFKARVDFLLDAAAPFTQTNTRLDPQTVSNALTSTVMLAFELQVLKHEKDVADFLRERGLFSGMENQVPDQLLQSLWADPAWARAATAAGQKSWRDPTFAALTHNAAVTHYALGYIYAKVGRTDHARQQYERALALEPTYQDAQTELDALNK